MKFQILGKINIADKEIDIKNQFTLILGKFKKEQIDQFQDFNTFDIFEDFDVISFEKFFTIFKNETFNVNFLRFVEILDPFLDTTEFLNQLIEKYSDLTQFFVQSLQLRVITNENKNLEKILKIRKKIDRTPILKENLDEIRDLNNLIIEKIKTLNYLEEDYNKQKMRSDRFISSLNNLQIKLKNLKLQKEKTFEKIKIITEENEDSRDMDNELTDSQRILKIQQQVKDYNYELKKLNENIEKESAKFQEFKLNFCLLKSSSK